MHKKPLVSVIVPTYNRGPGLKECLESIVRQSRKDFEIIVVDDCSLSETEAHSIVDSLARVHKDIRFKFLRQSKNGGHGKARNAGMTIAEGRIILFTDDDCIVPHDWVHTHVDAHERYPTAAGVGGWYWPPKNTSYYIYDRFFELQFEFSYHRMREVEVWTNTMNSPSGNSANMSFKTDILRTLGGFDEKIYFTGGIDWELKARCIAMNYSLVYIPNAILHTKAFTLKTFLTKTVKLGRGLDYIGRKYPGLSRPGLNEAVSLYIAWKISTVTRGEHAWIALAWGLSLIVGKWINIIYRFYPDETYEMRNPEYFLYRIQNGKRITSHELLLFDPSVPTEKQDYSGPVKYSVIIPTYNRRNFIADAVVSVLRQRHIHPRMYEIIVVDDGSSDGTKDVIGSLCEEYSDRTIRFHYKENGGAALARNTGADLAKGEILFFIDSDCRASPEWMWRSLEAYRMHPDIAGTGGGMLTVCSGSTILDHYRNTFSDNRFVMRYKKTLLKTNDIVSSVTPYDTASMSVRTEVFRRLGGFWPIRVSGFGQYHEDVDFAYRVEKTVGPMALVPQTAAYNYRLLSFRDFCEVAFRRGATIPLLTERIAPDAIILQEIPSRILVVGKFIQAVLRPFSAYSWIVLVNVERYAAGYRAGMRALKRSSDYPHHSYLRKALQKR